MATSFGFGVSLLFGQGYLCQSMSIQCSVVLIEVSNDILLSKVLFHLGLFWLFRWKAWCELCDYNFC
jgi:hypothetical protein